MRITASIVNPFNIENEVHPDITLIDLPTRENYVIVNDEKYKVCHTLFKKKDNDLSYEFEQKIITPTRQNYSRELLLLLGRILFEYEDELQFFFKKVKVNKGENMNYDMNNLIEVPYNYMRKLDLIEVNNDILLCENIIVRQDIEIIINLFESPHTLKAFREDKNDFCVHR